MGLNDIKLLGAAQVAKVLGVSESTFWRMRERGEFFEPMVIGARKGWPEYAVIDWVKQEFENAQLSKPYIECLKHF